MATTKLHVVHQALSSIGFDFESYYVRPFKNFHGGLDDSSEYGVLRDLRNPEVTKERLAEVFLIAKERHTYLVIFPEVREIRRFWQKKTSTKAASNEMFIGFIQKGVFETALDTAALVRGSINRNFLYLQEDEEVLKLEQIVTGIGEKLSAFQKRALDSDLLEVNSVKLLSGVEKEWKTLLLSKPFEILMEDSAHEYYAKMMCGAAYCIWTVCTAVRMEPGIV